MRSRGFRWLLYLAAGAVIVMALLVGLVRLLLPLVPDYQDDIRAWASKATGYDIGFESISASWPLSGPELSFYQVTLTRPGETEAVLAARELSAGVSLFRLLRDQRPTIGHVAMTGSRVRIERTPTDELLIQGRTLAELLPKRQRDRPPELDLELHDVAISFLDTRRAPEPVALTLDELHASIEPEQLAATAQLRLPREFGDQLEVELDVPLPLPQPLALPSQWSARLAGSGVDIARLATYGLGDTGPFRAAAGDATLELAFGDGVAQRVAAHFDLHDVTVGRTVYQALAGQVDWARGATGWDAALTGLRLRRGGRDTPASTAKLHYEAAGESTPERWTASAGFMRLDDLYPFVRAVLAGTEMEASLPRVVQGDVRDVEAEFAAQAEEPSRYSLRLAFERLGVTTASGDVAVQGLSGSVAADGDGGRLQLASSEVAVTLNQWFRDTLRAQTLQGLLIWRSGPEGVRFLSDDVNLKTSAVDISSRVELQFPADASSPVIDLKANGSGSDAREILAYLPLNRFPPKVVDWLERAVVAGKVPKLTVEFRGPLREFPYDYGEGVFRAVLDMQDGSLDYANGWPRIDNIEAEVVFDGVGMYSTTNRARLGNLPVRDYDVRIRDLRRGILAVSGGQRSNVGDMLTFVRTTPLSRTMGAVLERVTGSGPVDAAVRLALPLTRPNEYKLDVLLDPRGARMALVRVPLDLRDIRGRVRLHNTHFSATGVKAVMLGEPVTIDLVPATRADAPVSHTAEITGATPVARITSTFGLPLREYFDGRAEWHATVRIPGHRENAPVPLAIAIETDLRGVSSSLPAPLAKPADVAWPVTLDVTFPEGDYIEFGGRMEPPFAWAVRLANAGGKWRVERGTLRAGEGAVRLPQRRGLEVVGSVAELRLSDWLDVGDGGDGEPDNFRETWREFTLDARRLVVAGQVFGDVSATARRTADSWEVAVKGPQVEGNVTVPFDMTTRPLGLDMKRLWLMESEEGGRGAPIDPRNVMAVEVKAVDAALGAWHVGRLDMSVVRRPEGLVASRIATRSASFQIDGTGGWTVEGGDVNRQFTNLHATLKGNDIRDTLAQLGYDPVIEGKQANVKVDLVWPGGPAADFMQHAAGRIGIDMKDGQVVDLEPGGSGRLLGLLSVTALPRRLALDFSDVVNEGLAFDSIKGDFRVGSGSAYTCNLGLTGPVADIGMVGRTGFGARDYEQVAVVRPQVSNVLTVGGVVLGGPVGGVTMLLISQIFRKPLSTLGESYYTVSGGWDKPTVARVQRSEVDASAFKDCEKEVTAALAAGAIATPEDLSVAPAPSGAL